VIGVIDGTHVQIQAPSIDEPMYVNRMCYHSINTLVMFLKIVKYVTKWIVCCKSLCFLQIVYSQYEKTMCIVIKLFYCLTFFLHTLPFNCIIVDFNPFIVWLSLCTQCNLIVVLLILLARLFSEKTWAIVIASPPSTLGVVLKP